jgi:pimeloyl-ACP methyl ester carboxylesterase
MLRERIFDAGGVALNLAEGPPAGPPLVLLHGGSARWQSWEPLVPALAGGWEIFAPDLRGHGKSGRVPQRYRLRDYAGDIAALLRQRVREPAVLFGHSLGGMIALLVAAQCPEHVRAVVVGDSPLTGATWHALIAHDRASLATWRELSGGRRPIAAIVEALKNTQIVSSPGKPAPMRQVWGEDSPVYDWLAANLYQQDPDVLGALLDDFADAAAGYDMETLLPAIDCPVLLLQADPASGGIMTDADVTRALTLLKRPAHVRLAGLSHIMHGERKEPVLAALLPFLDQWRGAEAKR